MGHSSRALPLAAHFQLYQQVHFQRARPPHLSFKLIFCPPSFVITGEDGQLCLIKMVWRAVMARVVFYFRDRVLRFALIKTSFMFPKPSVSPLSFLIIGRCGMLGLNYYYPVTFSAYICLMLNFSLFTSEGWDRAACTSKLLLTAPSTIFVPENWLNYVNGCFSLLCVATQLVHLPGCNLFS